MHLDLRREKARVPCLHSVCVAAAVVVAVDVAVDVAVAVVFAVAVAVAVVFAAAAVAAAAAAAAVASRLADHLAEGTLLLAVGASSVCLRKTEYPLRHRTAPSSTDRTLCRVSLIGTL